VGKLSAGPDTRRENRRVVSDQQTPRRLELLPSTRDGDLPLRGARRQVGELGVGAEKDRDPSPGPVQRFQELTKVGDQSLADGRKMIDSPVLSKIASPALRHGKRHSERSFPKG